MKKIFLLLAFFIGAFALNAQKFYYEDFSVDTCDNAETIYFTSTKVFQDAGYVGIYWTADSLSGSTAATLKYQTDVPGSTNWYQFGSSATIDGVQTTGSYEGYFYGGKIRIAVTGSGTQSTKVKPILIYRRMR